jgi:hypothetical protein
LRRNDRVHPRPRTRSRRIDAPDQPMGDAAAQDHGMQRALRRKVADILAAPA